MQIKMAALDKLYHRMAIYFISMSRICTVFILLLVSMLAALLLFSFLFIHRGDYFILFIATCLFLAPLISRGWSFCFFLLILPFFGNKPGTTQTYNLIVLASALQLGFALYILKNFKNFYHLLDLRKPLLLLSFLYIVVSVVSLSSLPLKDLSAILNPKIVFSQDISSSAYILSSFAKSTEESLPYSYLSVFWTLLSFNFMLFCLLISQAESSFSHKFSLALLSGLLITLCAGLLDYYSVINLRFMRSLDPVVNPGDVQFRMQSFFGHSGWFAEYITLCIPFCMLILTFSFNFYFRIAAIISILLIGEISLILSFQRGGWISYPLTLLVVWASIYAFRKLEKGEVNLAAAIKGSLIKILISIPLTLIFTALLFYTLNLSGFVKSDQKEVLTRYAHRLGEIGKTSDRTDFMKAGLMLGSLYPFLGGGSESFAYHFNKEFNQPEGKFYQKLNLPLFGSAHNVYMQTFSGKGIAGLFLLLSMIFYMIYSCLNLALFQTSHRIQEKILLLIIASFSFAFLIYGNVQELFYVQPLQFIFFTVIGLALALHKNSGGLSDGKITLIYSIILSLIAAHFVWIYIYSSKYAQSDSSFGCYAKEHSAEGKTYRWCGVEAATRIAVNKKDDKYYASLILESGLNRGKNQSNSIRIYSNDTLLFESLMTQNSKQKFEFKLPPHIISNLQSVDGFTFLNINLKSDGYFIPARDMKGSADYRVLSYKIYLND